MPRRIFHARHRRPVGKRLHLRGQGGRAVFSLMKRVFSSYNQVLVHHARNVLAAEGVQSELRNQYLSSAMGELPP
ncbi:MAG: putative signal transducing protein, partial [Burkholderiales bacterium]